MICKELRWTFVTPAYIGGPNPAGPPSIRVRALTGNWRMWFRALAGGSIGTSKAARAKIHSMEKEHFGGIFGKAGNARDIRVELLRFAPFDPRDYHSGPTKDFVSYLGYGLGDKQRRAIPPGTEFTLRVLSDEQTWRKIEPVLWFWSWFGGVGARNRRGFGCVQAKDLPFEDPRKVVARFREAWGIEANEPEPLPEFEVVNGKSFLVKLVPTVYPKWEDALRAVRNQLRIDVGREPNGPGTCLDVNSFGFRQRTPAGIPAAMTRTGSNFQYYPTVDKGAAWNLFQRRSRGPERLFNIEFGLPLPFPGWRGLTINATNRRDEPLRRASPLQFRLWRAKDGWQVVVVFSDCLFLPDDVGVKPKGGGSVVKPTNMTHARSFFNSIRGGVLPL